MEHLEEIHRVTVSVCKRFQFVIRSVNNLKTPGNKIVNQSENG